MTLKEKVMQEQPEKVGEFYTGGVSACPADYPYLHDKMCLNDYDGVTGYCTEANEEKCAECWNREFVPAADAVNHPEHYKRYKHECIDEMIALFGVDAVKAFCRCNAYKYRYRAGAKGDAAEDLKKAEWYMDKLMELEGVTNGEDS